MNDNTYRYLVFLTSVAAITVLSIAYWLIFRSDTYVLAAAGGIIGGLLGYIFGRRGGENA